MQGLNAQSTGSLQYAVPQVDELSKHSIPTWLESFSKAKLTIRQQPLLFQNSFIDAMTLALSNAQVEHLN